MKSKVFDCVEMKDQIQAQLLEKWKCLTDAEIRQQIAHELSTSDNPVARWWRKVQEVQRPAITK